MISHETDKKCEDVVPVLAPGRARPNTRYPESIGDLRCAAWRYSLVELSENAYGGPYLAHGDRPNPAAVLPAFNPAAFTGVVGSSKPATLRAGAPV